MDEIRTIYRETKIFLWLSFIFVFIGILGTAFYGKGQLHLLLNQYNSAFFDEFFKYLTYLGSGWALIVVIVLLALKYKRAAGGLLMSGLLVGFFTQLLKHSINEVRPVRYFELYMPDVQLHLVEGVTVHKALSFPSGHAATAFAIFFYLSFFVRNRFLKFVLWLLAVLVSYSRVYLSQHFVHDVVSGAVLGILMSYLGLWWYLKTEKINNLRGV